ncbi:hypothetical protein OGAPHI_001140 [Ogataea philodendri]|uniref:K Homology domain-containing protein n=1 Tax=Ogataea philodendri TaxID=1378263 RepID=A0A9P8T9T0_9ASCO|nr:uncharacterized protein OGAPHI_001140 [Ogataea philodendri]KAH3670625.1 hypothetical protein OGAPHI_001140 [Ogataea philodendri]
MLSLRPFLEDPLQTSPARAYLDPCEDSGVGTVTLVLGPKSRLIPLLDELGPQQTVSNVFIDLFRVHACLMEWAVSISGPPQRVWDIYSLENTAVTHKQRAPLQKMDLNTNTTIAKQYRVLRQEAGSLIGKKGRDIEKIREQTTAKIKIHSPDELDLKTNQTQLIEVSGSKEEVLHAERLIQTKIFNYRATKS